MKPTPWEARPGRSVIIAQDGSSTATGSTLTKRKSTRIEEPLVLPRADSSEPPMETFVFMDERYSLRIYEFGRRHVGLRYLSIVAETLMHGLVWLGIVGILFLAQTEAGAPRTILANLIMGLLIDMGMCGLLKLLVKRNRPHYNQGRIFASVPIDDYSFPSGHSSRGGFLWMFFCAFEPFGVPQPVKLLLIVAPAALAASRVLVGRHYLADVVCGFFFGCFFYVATLIFWLPEDTVNSIWFQLNAAIPLFRDR